MSVPLSVRIGDDTHVTRHLDDLAPGEGLHGPAECGFNLARPLTVGFAAFERVYVFDTSTGDTVWEGRLEDPGRTVSGDGIRWDASAIGETARASDTTLALIYIDRDLQRWLSAAITTATSASMEVTEVPNQEGVDGWKLQLNPGQPIDATTNVVIRYNAIADAGMTVGFLQFTVVDGFDGVGQENRSWQGNPDNQIHTVAFTMTPTTQTARLGNNLLDTGSDFFDLVLRRTASATNVGADNNWAAFYDITVGAKRVLRDGTDDTDSVNYQPYVLAHQVVADLLGRVLTSYDGAGADIDTSGTHQFDQLAYPDGVTAEQLFTDLMALEPEFYWQVGVSNPSTGKPTFAWRRWPTHVRYEASLRDGISLPGADAERYDEVMVRWKDHRERIRFTLRTRVVPELDAAGLHRRGYLDLGDEVSSAANATKAGDEFLTEHATPPASGTLTVAHDVYDADEGRYVRPWEIQTGHLVRVRELVDGPDDLFDTGADGRCVFRVVGRSYQVSDNTAQLELDAEPRTDTNELAKQMTKRTRKR